MLPWENRGYLMNISLLFFAVQPLSFVQLFVTPWGTAYRASLFSTVSCPLSLLCYLIISSSATLFSFCLQSFPAAGSFPMSLLFASGGQSFGASASVSVLPMNIQDWFPLGLTDLISLLSKELSRISSSITIKKHQFFDMNPFLWSSSPIHAWQLEKP